MDNFRIIENAIQSTPTLPPVIKEIVDEGVIHLLCNYRIVQKANVILVHDSRPMVAIPEAMRTKERVYGNRRLIVSHIGKMIPTVPLISINMIYMYGTNLNVVCTVDDNDLPRPLILGEHHFVTKPAYEMLKKTLFLYGFNRKLVKRPLFLTNNIGFPIKGFSSSEFTIELDRRVKIPRTSAIFYRVLR